MISPALAAKVADVLTQVDTAAARAEKAAADATSGLSSWWQGVVGSSSSAEALASLAHSQRSLAAAVRARAGKLTSDADAVAFLQDASRNKWAVISNVDELARFLSFSGGVTTIAKDTAKDVAAAAKVSLPLVAIAAVAFLVFRFGGRRS